jgi:hypothetical protein
MSSGSFEVNVLDGVNKITIEAGKTWTNSWRNNRLNSSRITCDALRALVKLGRTGESQAYSESCGNERANHYAVEVLKRRSKASVLISIMYLLPTVNLQNCEQH